MSVTSSRITPCGNRDNRAGLTNALAFVRPGDCLVVWKLDRLGRLPNNPDFAP
jgi:DNA invertase Pin-like site-specific DNA recombinase